MKPLLLREQMSMEDVAEFGPDHPHRITYASGAVNLYLTETPIQLVVSDFWMPLERAKEIHKWLGQAIKQVEKYK